MKHLEMMMLEWEEGFSIRVGIADNTVVLSANKEGLLSLARQLIALSEETPGSHLHYDKYNSLEEDSSDLVVELMNLPAPTKGELIKSE